MKAKVIHDQSHTTSRKNNDYCSAIFGSHIFGINDKQRDTSYESLSSAGGITASTSTSTSTSSQNNNTKGSAKSGRSKIAPMVRTCSASADVVNKRKHISNKSHNDNKHHDDNNANSKSHNGKPQGLSSHNRNASYTFDAVDYHEITLIRNRKLSKYNTLMHSNTNNNNGTESNNRNDYIDFLDWDAITIRCANHDELDVIVKALKDSSKATVVPFSSNPKERLKKMVAQRKRLCTDLGSRSFCDKSDKTKAISVVDNIAEETDTKTPKENKHGWDFNFNKKEYCELCNLVFTLLTRRHHCRKCERSCCGNCSSLLLVKGGDEKRYCNICSADILRKQSEAVRGRWKNRYLLDDKLPGKVHPACNKLGVGVMGKLPHWKTFLTRKVEERPAVGRITIEVLEAIALPSVDMMNGKVDPYVRATITGYDRDMLWTLREWMNHKRHSLCSGYVSSTLCPQWRGKGKKGGELLTLPLISTAGAVLRLEVMHYNIMTNSRGKDSVLGVVEIPLSDLPNANLRQPSGFLNSSAWRRKSLLYDGYCDRWYRLLSSDHLNSNSVVLSKPATSPHVQQEESSLSEKKVGGGMKSLEEIGKRVQGFCIAPVEWFAAAIKLDLPSRRPEAICKEHEERSMIHVRIKLNASVQGDVLSHAWFPPVKPRPSVPPFDPQVLFTRIRFVCKHLAPYRKIQQYIEKVLKWQLEPKVCAKAYFVFAIHLSLLPWLVKIFHIYLFIFLAIRLKEMKLESDDIDEDERPLLPHLDSISSDDFSSIDNNNNDQKSNGEGSNNTAAATERLDFHDSPSLTEFNTLVRGNSTIQIETESSTRDGVISKNDSDDDEEARLNIAVNWIAKRWLDNKGLEILQFKLGMLGRDLKNLNSVWNGSNPLLTRAAMVYLVLSFMLHFIINQRLLWLLGTFTWYFARSPVSILCARMFFGFWRGVAKGLRRQHLIDAEMLQNMNEDR